MSTIDVFNGEFFFLSNFYYCNITYNGLEFTNAEAAFQSMKCISDIQRKLFRHLNPSSAKRLGRSVALRHDWESIKLSVMEDVIRAKFTQNPDLARKLIVTGNAKLIEGNTWGDAYWGFDLRKNAGENHLGIILMKIRKELKRANK